MTMASSPSIAALSNEVLLHALTFVADRRGATAAMLTCRHWRDVINEDGDGPGALWRELVASTHPSIIQVASGRTPAGGWRDLFLRPERLAALVDGRVRETIAQYGETFREWEELFGLTSDGPPGWPYASPTKGTTATETPDTRGAYSRPVYFDWRANWERVKELVSIPAVQAALQRSVSEARGGGYFDSWDEGKIWPFLFLKRERYLQYGEQDELMRLFLPRECTRELNGRVADWFRARAEVLLDDHELDEDIAEWAAEIVEGLERGLGEISEDEFSASVWKCVHGIADEYLSIHEETSGIELMHEIEEAAEAALYHPDNSALRETLLFAPTNSYAFMPLNYVLARLLSPEDAQLEVYASGKYSVVIDARRNILFDNFRYFVDAFDASETLEQSRDMPQLPPSKFDYSLGGLRELGEKLG